MSNRSSWLPRRHALMRSAAAVAAAGMASFTGRVAAQTQTPSPASPPAPSPTPGAKPLPPYAAWKSEPHLIVHSANTIETKRSAFGAGIVTPSDRLYVRNNLPPPDASIIADPDAWEVGIEGVKLPRRLTVRELKTLGLDTVAMVLQCSGNGRGFFPSKPTGTPWTVGAAGCVVFTGVPLREVVQALGGVADGMAFITGTGGEKLPEGVDPKSVMVERSVPIQALGDALLAWELNGQPLPLAHGGPLRLVLPGYSGINNIKYVKRVAFTARETDARIMSHGYRVTPPGGKADPSQPSVLEMSVKSWINSPSGDGTPLRAGAVQIHGVAFGGTRALRRVEVSTDGGKSWREARFVGPDLGRFAWRQFAFTTRLAPGTHTLACRATDSAGVVQPEVRDENTGGYSNTSWADHAVKVTVV